jgi:hypothetical protein
MNDATLRLSRTWSGIGIGAQSEQWNIAIDGTVVGSIANKETVEVSVEPGHHALRLGSGRHRSPERSFDIAQDEVVGFRATVPGSGRCWWRHSSSRTSGSRSEGVNWRHLGVAWLSKVDDTSTRSASHVRGTSTDGWGERIRTSNLCLSAVAPRVEGERNVISYQADSFSDRAEIVRGGLPVRAPSPAPA